MMDETTEALKLKVIDTDSHALLVLGSPHGASLTQIVPWLTLDALRKAVGALRSRPVGVISNVEREIKAVEDAEAQLGRLIAGIFSPGLWALILERVATNRGKSRLMLAVEAEGVAAREVPWELLAQGTAETSLNYLNTNELSVVRLHASDQWPGRLFGARLRVVASSPDPEDRVLSSAMKVLRAKLAPHHIPIEDLTRSMDTAPEHGVEELICLFAHGLILQDGRLWVKTANENARLETFSVALGERMRRSLAVVLLVCSAGDATPDDNLAAHLIRAGAPAVFAAQAPLSAAHAVAFVAGLAPALSKGATLLAALAQARAEVAQLYDASLYNRHWLMSLCVGSVQTPGRHLLPVALPALVFRASLSLRSFIVEVLELLRDEPGLGGFLGVEALLIGMARRPAYVEGTLLHEVARIGRVHQAELRTRLDGLRRTRSATTATAIPTASGPTPPPLTPRLERALKEMPEGAGLEDLWVELLKARFFVLGELREISGDGTLGTVSVGNAARPCAREQRPHCPPCEVEVVGGPEDGRCVPYPTSSTPILRFRGSFAQDSIRLYDGTLVSDNALSSRTPDLTLEPDGHLRWKRRGAASNKVHQGSVVKVIGATWIGFW